MIRTRWQKVLIDLWKNRTRTLIVALAIAVGVYAVGVVLSTRELVVREYRSDQDGALLPSAILHTYPFGDDLAGRIAEIPGVAAAEGRNLTRVRVYEDAPSPGAASKGPQRDLVLVSIPDFEDMRVGALTPLDGRFPPAKREIILERLALESLGVGIGDEITIELDSGAERTLTVVGSAHDPQTLSTTVWMRAGLPSAYSIVNWPFPSGRSHSISAFSRASARRSIIRWESWIGMGISSGVSLQANPNMIP